MKNRMNIGILAGMLVGTALSSAGCSSFFPRYKETPMPNVPIQKCTYNRMEKLQVGLEPCDEREEYAATSGIFCLLMQGQIPVYARIYNSSQSPVKVLSRECFISDNEGERWTYLPVQEMTKHGELESNIGIGDVAFEALFVPKVVSVPHRLSVFRYNSSRKKDMEHKILPPVFTVEPGKETVGFIPLIREKHGFVDLAQRLPGGSLHFFFEQDGERIEYPFELGRPERVLIASREEK